MLTRTSRRRPRASAELQADPAQPSPLLSAAPQTLAWFGGDFQRQDNRSAPVTEHVPGPASARPEGLGTLSPAATTLQPRLAVNPPNDVYEQEAEAMADTILRMPNPGMIHRRAASNSIQRCGKCAKAQRIEDMCPSCAAKALQASGGTLQLSANALVPEVTPSIEANVAQLQNSGAPLSNDVRAFMEPRFGHDFSQVRIHNDARAAGVARSINALAFTVGNNIAFDAGQYQPNTEAGQRLLAHELTHVVQQTGGGQALPMPAGEQAQALQRSVRLLTAPTSIQRREMWELSGSDAESCKEQIAEDTAVCSDHANTACTAGAATMAGGSALLGGAIGSIFPGPGTAIGAGIGFVGGVIGGVIGYGKCMEVANAKCREIGRRKTRECDARFATSSLDLPSNTDDSNVPEEALA
jgi:hypothetical protein